MSIPSNWRELPNNETVTFAPDGGYGDYNGQSTFTHGIEFGVARNESHDLQTATAELVADLPVSILVDERFGGTWDDLRAARLAAGLPLLAKGFFSTQEDLRTAKGAGADAALLL